MVDESSNLCKSGTTELEAYQFTLKTALAFHRTKNPTDKPAIGISTSFIYFNKIQCCFEEQRLNPQEEVDMLVFFYTDPEFAEDSRMVNVDLITLSYTFFEAKEGHTLPVPGYNSNQQLSPASNL